MWWARLQGPRAGIGTAPVVWTELRLRASAERRRQEERERALRGPSVCMPRSEQTHSHSATSFYLLGKRSPVRFTFCRSTHVPVSHQPVSGLPRASVGGATEALTGVALASLRSPSSRSRRIGPQAFRLFPRPAVPCPIAGASRLPCLRPRLSSFCSVPSLFSCLSRMPLSPEASTSILDPPLTLD